MNVSLPLPASNYQINLSMPQHPPCLTPADPFQARSCRSEKCCLHCYPATSSFVQWRPGPPWTLGNILPCGCDTGESLLLGRHCQPPHQLPSSSELSGKLGTTMSCECRLTWITPATQPCIHFGLVKSKISDHAPPHPGFTSADNRYNDNSALNARLDTWRP